MDLGVGRVSHSFLVMPDCPYPLLGRDILTKIGAHIYFNPEGPQVTDKRGDPIHVLTIHLEDEYRLFENLKEGKKDIDWWVKKYPKAWAETAGLRKARKQPPVQIELKPQAAPVAVRQYPMSKEAMMGFALIYSDSLT